MSAWVLKNAIEGRTKESELAKGKASKYVHVIVFVFDDVLYGAHYSSPLTTTTLRIDQRDKHEWRKKRMT